MDTLIVVATRGALVESRHAVTAVVADAAGRVVWSAGAVDAPYYPRSAIKALLALPVVESGIADRFGWDDRCLALAVSSHDGSPEHEALAETMLLAAGRGVEDLACGVHWPLSRNAAHRLAAAGRAPCPLHNNCSGKHAGLIALSVGLGVDPAGYHEPGHAAMREATASLARETGAACGPANEATDGCSIPTYALPLTALARGFARLGTGAFMPPARARAARRLREAVAAHPRLVAGEGRFDTVLNEALGLSAFVKGGAEGIWCASLPERGLGIAVKAEDGASRAAQAATSFLLARFGGAHAVLADWPGRVLANWRGTAVGEIRVEGAAL